MADIRLRQSTAAVISFGPFVDQTDGVTLKTALAGTGANQIDNATTGIMLSKNGGVLAVRSATVTASTYDAMGCYRVTLNATDTATLGKLRVIYANAAVCLPVWVDFEVMTAALYDHTVLGDLGTIDGVTAADWAESMQAVLYGTTAPSGSTVPFRKRDGTTTKVTVTYGSTDGQRTGSTIS